MGQNESTANEGQQPDSFPTIPPDTSQVKSKKSKKRKKDEQVENGQKKLKVEDAQLKKTIVSASYSDIFGIDAKPSIRMNPDSSHYGQLRISLFNIQELLFSILSDGLAPKWCIMQNRSRIQKVVLILINSLDSSTYSKHIEVLDSFNTIASSCGACYMYPSYYLKNKPEDIFDERRNAQFWRNHFINGLFFRRVVSKEKNNKQSTNNTVSGTLTLLNKSEDKKDTSKQQNEEKETHQIKLKPEELLLSLMQLKENDFPLEAVDDTFVESDTIIDCATSHKLVSLDCEMCITEKGFEVTRVTMVDEEETVLYDNFVLPENPIIDYNTKYSGISAEHLKDVTRTLSDVQQEMKKIVSKDTILVGHSLENDLNKLRFVHKKVIDTSVIYPHPKGKEYKLPLKQLCFQHLRRTIQGSKQGHDSVEDSIAALDLVKLKLEKGKQYGDPFAGAQRENILPYFVKNQKDCLLMDRANYLNIVMNSCASGVNVQSDEELVSKLEKMIDKPTYSFIFAHFHALEEYYENKPFLNEEANTKEIEQVLIKLNQQVKSIYEKVPSNTLVMIVTPHGNLNKLEKLAIEKKTSETIENLNKLNKNLEATHDAVSKGLCFMGVKN